MTPVECEQIRDALARGVVPSEPEATAHVRSCPRCSELVADGGRLGRELAALSHADSGPPAFWDEVAHDVGKDAGVHGWLRSRPTPARLALAMAAAALGAVIAVFRLRPDWAAVAKLPLVMGFAVDAGALYACVALVLRNRARPPLPRPSALLVLAFVLPVASALVASTATQHPTATFSTEACFTFGTLLTVPFVLVVASVQRDAALGPFKSALLGAAAGLLANAALLFHCPSSDLGHLLLGHAVIGAVLAVAALSLTSLRRAH